MDQLEDMDRLRQVAQAQHAGIAQAGAVGQGLADQRFGRRGEQCLPAVRHRQQTGNAVDRRAEVVAATQIRRAGVQRDAHPQLGARRPFLGAKAGLNLAGCLQRAGSILEGDAESVADGLEDAAAVALDRRGEQHVVALQGRRMA
jgi:hypothetical protein